MSNDSKAKDTKVLEAKQAPAKPLEKLATPPAQERHLGKDVAATIYELLGRDYPTEEEFCELLRHVSPGVLAKRYLSSGLPYVFRNEPHKYLAFREAVAKIFGVRPQDIAVMGSARFGFSTNPHKQTEDGAKLLNHNSDMDLVVISDVVYRRALESFAKYSFTMLRDVEGLKKEVTKNDEVKVNAFALQAIRKRAKGFLYGYVNPSDLEDNTPEKQQFYDMKREAGTQLFGTAPPGPIHRVGAWIYRDWDAAERMYEFSFRELSKKLGIGEMEDTEMPGDLENEVD